jgi:hypothetical protein
MEAQRPRVSALAGRKDDKRRDATPSPPQVLAQRFNIRGPAGAQHREGELFSNTSWSPITAALRLGARGAKLVGDVVQYEGMYRLCYVRGPEGILIGLAQQLGQETSRANPMK